SVVGNFEPDSRQAPFLETIGYAPKVTDAPRTALQRLVSTDEIQKSARPLVSFFRLARVMNQEHRRAQFYSMKHRVQRRKKCSELFGKFVLREVGNRIHDE